jgi:hypothetical protein
VGIACPPNLGCGECGREVSLPTDTIGHPAGNEK